MTNKVKRKKNFADLATKKNFKKDKTKKKMYVLQWQSINTKKFIEKNSKMPG